MISRALVPTDNSEMSGRALKYALETHAGVDITVLHVVREPSPMMGKAMSLVLESDIEQAVEEHASEVLQHARDTADQYDIKIQYFTKLFS